MLIFVNNPTESVINPYEAVLKQKMRQCILWFAAFVFLKQMLKSGICAHHMQLFTYLGSAVITSVIHQSCERADMHEHASIHLLSDLILRSDGIHEAFGALQYYERSLKSVRLEGIDETLSSFVLNIA